MWRIFTKEWWLGEVSSVEIQELEEEISNRKTQLDELKAQLKAKDDEIVRDAILIRECGQKENKAKKEIASLESQLREKEIDLKRAKIELRRRRKETTNNQELLIREYKIRILERRTDQFQKMIGKKEAHLKSVEEDLKKAEEELKKKGDDLAERDRKLISVLEAIDKLKKETENEKLGKGKEIVIGKWETDLKRAKIELRRRRKEATKEALLKTEKEFRKLRIKTIRLRKIIEEKDEELKEKEEEMRVRGKKLIAMLESMDKLRKETEKEKQEKDKEIKQLEGNLKKVQREIVSPKSQVSKREVVSERLETDLKRAKIELRRRRKEVTNYQRLLKSKEKETRILERKTDQLKKITEPTDREEETSSRTGSGTGLARSLILMLILAPILIMQPNSLPMTYNQTPSEVETETVIETEPITEAEVSIETETETITEASTEIEIKSPLICIDPGHEGLGENTGTQGIVTGTPEYAANLEISLKLKKVLEDQGMRVVMTREWNEVYIPNQVRVLMANKAQADLFILIHCNGSKNPKENGSYIFYPPENRKTKAICQKSKEAGTLILDELSRINRGGLGRLLATYENMDKRVCCGSSYLILKHTKVPAVLVEVGYLTNPREDSLLNSEDYQKKVATAMSNGVIRYLLNNEWKITKASSF